MKARAPYDFITEKLEQFPAADSHDLWEQMQQQLDVAMPVKEDHRRRFMVFQLVASLIIMISVSLIYVNHVPNTDQKSISTTTLTTLSPEKVESKEGANNHSVKQTLLVQHHLSTKKANKIKSDKLQNNINYVQTKDYLVQHSTNNISTAVISNDKKSENYSTSLHKNNNTAINNSRDQLTGGNNRVPGNQLLATIQKEFSSKVVLNQSLAKNPVLVNNNVSIAELKQSNVITTPGYTVSIPERNPTITDPRITQIDAQNLSLFTYRGMDSVLQHSLVTSIANLQARTHNKGWVVGVAMNFHLPVSHQEMSTVNINGKQNALFDYLPSVYVQYHFSDKLYLSTELGWVNPQYTPNVELFDHYTKVSNTQKQEDEVILNKLYYLNLPLTVNYRVANNLYVGTGIEYSYLQRSILNGEHCIWEQQGATWVMTKETTYVSVNANPKAVAKKNNGNPSIQPTDNVAESFRSADWRALVDVNYHYRHFVLGMNFAMGLTPYIKVQSGSSSGDIKDRNEAVQLYLHYNLFDRRK